jgi:Methyltransferase FkbM domain
MMQFGRYTLKRCRYGWMLFTGPYIGKCFDLYGEYSESEVQVMRDFVRPGNWVVDIGANIGSLTVPLSQLVGESGRVLAVESHPENFNVLCSNLALNSITNVKPVNCFIHQSPEFAVREMFTGPVWNPVKSSIDAFALPACHFIKIDVDGNELDVIRSGSETIAKHRPILYFENDVKEASKNLLQHVFDLDYRLYQHAAPIFRPDNFFLNPVNHWVPQNIVSLMVLGVPRERDITLQGIQELLRPEDYIFPG